MRKTITLMLLMLGLVTQAQTTNQKSPVTWNGYTQLRFSTNFDNINSFAMRRLKLWAHSTPDFNEHWGFKMQTTITSYQNEKFLLQDVLFFYKQGQFRVNMGQFVPHFSLQRFQHDYEIPVIERANVINALIPNGTLGVRDIGVEGEYASPNKNVEAWFGVFNGNGIKEYRLNNQGIMLTQKTQVKFIQNHLMLGYSLMYRKADQLTLHVVLPDSVAFSSDDMRFNFFAEYQAGDFHLQAEYLWASLNQQIANGWYVLTWYDINKNQIIASWNQYNDLIATTDDLSVVHLGYNYAIKGDKLKVMLDNSFQIDNGLISHYLTTIQLQLFFK